MTQAQSIYRQVRLVVTEQSNGLVMVRVHTKAMLEDWRTLHLVHAAQFRPTTSTTHWSELLTAAAEDVLAQRLFPE